MSAKPPLPQDTFNPQKENHSFFRSCSDPNDRGFKSSTFPGPLGPALSHQQGLVKREWAKGEGLTIEADQAPSTWATPGSDAERLIRGLARAGVNHKAGRVSSRPAHTSSPPHAGKAAQASSPPRPGESSQQRSSPPEPPHLRLRCCTAHSLPCRAGCPSPLTPTAPSSGPGEEAGFSPLSPSPSPTSAPGFPSGHAQSAAPVCIWIGVTRQPRRSPPAS